MSKKKCGNNKKDKPLKPPFLSRVSFNYLFFGSYFFIASFIHVFHVLLIEPTASFSRWFFIIYSIAQCALETIILIICASLIKRFLPKFFYLLFICFIFILFLSHVIDFPMIRLMDMSFWYALNFISQESYANIIELLYASNVSLLIWGAGIVLALVILLGGVFVHRLTEKWTEKYPCYVTYPFLVAVLGVISFFIFNLESSTKHLISLSQFEMYEKTLGWKTTFAPPPSKYIALDRLLKEPESENLVLSRLDPKLGALAKKPDIYLFVIESLREDYITEINTPELHRFKQNNTSFDLALSNANATHVSWFSLFYSQYPLYWGKLNPGNWKKGSIPLQMLKQMGYTIHVSSSSRLGYYQMDHLIFGEECYLADSLYTLDDSDLEESYQRDQMAMNKVLEKMGDTKNCSGRVFIVFLDASHLDYSWPKETGSIFVPFEEKINYFKAAVTNDSVERIRNRYRNSLYFIDSLFGEFFKKLDCCKGGKESIVVITGDHGEEFYEQGHLFHASDLSRQQTHVPLYYKLPESFSAYTKPSMTCHMDIFPTLLHCLTGVDSFEGILQGQSIFKEERWPYVIAARFNASRTPYKFFIHNGLEKVTGRFSNDRNIFQSKKIHILSTKNLLDENIIIDMQVLQGRFNEALDRMCGSNQ